MEMAAMAVTCGRITPNSFSRSWQRGDAVHERTLEAAVLLLFEHVAVDEAVVLLRVGRRAQLDPELHPVDVGVEEVLRTSLPLPAMLPAVAVAARADLHRPASARTA